jgi:hypothetical protein
MDKERQTEREREKERDRDKRERERERGRGREIKSLKGCSMCLVVTHYHLSQRVITGNIATHGKLCMQAEGYSAPTAHQHLPIPHTLELNVISISER